MSGGGCPFGHGNSAPAPTNPVDTAEYGEYLGLNTILNAQHLKSADHFEKPAHDEMLFIIIHQTYELWFKQILWELDSIVDIFKQPVVQERHLSTVVSRLVRVTEIQRVMIQQVSVLETMTPMGFLDFRGLLVGASGFQSGQFRMFENKLGLRREQRLNYNQREYHAALNDDIRDKVLETQESPSLFDFVEKWLERMPFDHFKDWDFWEKYRGVVDQIMNEDLSIIDAADGLTEEDRITRKKEVEKTRDSFSAIFDEEKHKDLMEKGARRLSFKALRAAIFIYLYRDEPILAMPFRLLNLLTEIDAQLVTWRSRHSQMVYRMIGTRVGTGGSSGYYYLRATIEKHRIFSDLFNIPTYLISSRGLPQLPPEVQSSLNFKFEVSAGNVAGDL